MSLTRRTQTIPFNKIVIATIKDEIDQSNFPDNASDMYLNNSRTSICYMLPKIQTVDINGRPIGSAVSCPTSNISAFPDGILAPIAQTRPTSVKDSSDALKIVDDFKFPSETRFLFTMEVKFIYIVVPNQDGLIALKHFLNSCPVQNPPTNTLIRLTELVLIQNFFSFHGNVYVQVGGVARGSKLGSNYVFCWISETSHYSAIPSTFPCRIRRYIDDIVGATSLSQFQL